MKGWMAAAAGLVLAGAAGAALWVAGHSSAASAPGSGVQATQQKYRSITKFGVRYDDLNYGPIEGVAYCKWDEWCDVTLRNPKSGALVTLGTRSAALDIEHPKADGDPLIVRLHGSSGHVEPSSPIAMPALVGPHVNAAIGDRLSIVVKNGSVEKRSPIPVAATVTPDSNTVTLTLFPGPDGELAGYWSALASPLTKRDGSNGGRTGVFDTVRDDEIALVDARYSGAGGFAGVQRGMEMWTPKLPRLYAHVLEDQSEFNGRALRYPWAYRAPNGPALVRPGASGPPSSTPAQKCPGEEMCRTLVVFGRDFPAAKGTPILPIDDSPDGVLHYDVLRILDAASTDPDVARARFALEATMDENARAEFRKQEAAVVQVSGIGAPADPGPQTLTWGTGQATWELQYGDNTADARFMRWVNDKESEATGQLALPEKVFVEIDVGSEFFTDKSVPVVVGTSETDQISLTATVENCRLAPPARRRAASDHEPPAHPRFCTPEFVVATSDNPPIGVGGAKTLTVLKGAHLLATVDRKQTHFLRSSIGAAVASEPSTLWTKALQEAVSCKIPPGRSGAEAVGADWPNVAKLTEETISKKFKSVPVAYGDHAAMLVERAVFEQMLLQQRAGLDVVAPADERSESSIATSVLEEVDAAESENALVDAWYRTIHDPVTRVEEFPLAAVKVSSPSGEIEFRQAYDLRWREDTFHISTTADGEERYRQWRRDAARRAMASYKSAVSDAIARVQELDRCDLDELINLTGTGMGRVAAQIRPLMMKVRGPLQLAEPDFPARSYITGLDTTAQAVGALKVYSQAANAVIVFSAIGLTGPVAGAGAWFGVPGLQAFGAATSFIGGFVALGIDSTYLISKTYDEHQEVRFAYGAATTLGLERFLEANSQKTEWWQAGLRIFGEAVMTGIGARGAWHSFGEGMSLWRGSRIAARLATSSAGSARLINAADIQALSEAERRELGFFLLREQARNARAGLFGGLQAWADETFGRLAYEVRTGPIPEALNPPAAEVQIEVQEALAPVDDFKTAVMPEDPLRTAKTEITNSNLEGDALANRARADADVGAPVPEGFGMAPGQEPVELGAGIEKPVEIDPPAAYRPKPYEPYPVKLMINGKLTPVNFKLGRLISGSSLFFNVYELEWTEELAGLIDKDLGQNLVIKILKVDDPKLLAQNEMVEGIKDHVVQRMLKAQARLEGTGIKALKIQGWDDVGIVVQSKFTVKKGQFEIFDVNNDWKAFKEGFLGDPDKQDAVARLYQQFIEKRLIWADGHIGNIYFVNDGNGWTAGVLDQDFLGTFGDMQEGPYVKYLDGMMRRAKSQGVAGDLRGTTPESVMEKMLEAKRWLQYSKSEKCLATDWLRPERVKAIVKGLPYVKTAAERAAAEAAREAARRAALGGTVKIPQGAAPAPPAAPAAPIDLTAPHPPPKQGASLYLSPFRIAA